MDPIEVTNADELQAALKAAEGGEVIIAQGEFGRIQLGQIHPEKPVTIDGSRGAHFERVELFGCANLHWTSCYFWPQRSIAELTVRADGQQGKAIPYLFTADPKSAGIELSSCLFRGRKDSDNHPSWQKADWADAHIGAAILYGDRGVVRNNLATGVSFGFTVRGPSSELFANRVFGFSGDALRVGGDNSVVIGNRISDAVLIDSNHPDAIQAFKPKEMLRGLVIKDNLALEWTINPRNPLRAKLQGVGLHNGPYADVVIRDNRIASSSFTGIRAHAVTNLELTGNQVRNADGPGKNFPFIRVEACSGRVVVQNNSAEKFVPPADASNGRPNYSQKW